MAFEFLRSVGQGEIAAAKDVLTIVVSQGAFPLLSRLAFLGQIGYLSELLLGTATLVMGVLGVFRCLGRSTHDFGAGRIDEQCNPSNGEQQGRDECASKRDVEVTIRLENGFLRTLHRQRCIVTIRRPSGGVQDTGREVWYARDAN